MYYLFIDNGKINGGSDLLQENVWTENYFQVEVSEELYNDYLANRDKYIYVDGEVIVDPDYEEHEAEREKARIGELQVTKRVFALALQQLGISYSQLKELIASNEQAQLEWDLCVELQRKNPLLDVMASQLGVSSETLDMIFKRANGED
jgi:hypothetical protein